MSCHVTKDPRKPNGAKTVFRRAGTFTRLCAHSRKPRTPQLHPQPTPPSRSSPKGPRNRRKHEIVKPPSKNTDLVFTILGWKSKTRRRKYRQTGLYKNFKFYKNFEFLVLGKILLRKWKDQSWTEKTYLQNAHLGEDLYPEYMGIDTPELSKFNPKVTTQVKNGQNLWDLSPKQVGVRAAKKPGEGRTHRHQGTAVKRVRAHTCRQGHLLRHARRLGTRHRPTARKTLGCFLRTRNASRGLGLRMSPGEMRVSVCPRTRTGAAGSARRQREAAPQSSSGAWTHKVGDIHTMLGKNERWTQQ